MLYPSDPSSSSSKVSAPGSDERIPEQDPAVVSVGDAHTQTFSIRNYVFASRSKNSGTSWPFPLWLLEFFLKHGVQDLLPPFEPRSSVRQPFLRSSEPEAEKIRNDSPQAGEVFLPDKQHNPTPTGSCLPSDGNSLSCLDKDEGQRPEDEKPSPEFGEPVVKKRRLALPGAISETSQTEEIASTSIASDPMASKVCPVCKTFSSTSNTTLNAHMDQCLSMASDATLTVDEIPKQKIKPRKKRLMEDVYATAPRCSLEDLDRRNGTSWATSLSLVSAPCEANAEAKELNLPQVDARDERSEGAVYVDSNGIKLRILSKFNNASQALSRDALLRPRRSIKQLRDGKIISVSGKKKNVRDKLANKLKLKMEKKKLRSLKLCKTEAASEAAQHEEALQEERLVPLSNELNQAHVSHETGTLQRWPSSKRSNLPKKICKKDFIKFLDHSEPVTQMENLDTRNSASGSYSSAKSHVKLTHFPESKTMDFTPSTLKRKEIKEKNCEECLLKSSSTNTICYKVSRASEALPPSPRSKNGEFYVGRKRELHDPLVKTIRISTLTGSTSSSKMTSKQHSVLRFDKRKGDHFFNSNGELQRCAEDAIRGSQDEQITAQCLNTGICQLEDAKQSCSKISKILFNKVEDGAITAISQCGEGTTKSLNGEGPELLLASDDKLSEALPTEDCGMLIKQLLLDKQDEPTPDKLESRCMESETGALSAESSACLTSHGDFELDIQREHCSIASGLVFPNQGRNSALIRELSESPTSNPFSPTLKGCHAKASEGEFWQCKEGSQQFRLDSIMNSPQQQSEYLHCCCSYQRILSGTMPTSKPKIFPNLYIKPSISSTFDAYSSLQTDMGNAAFFGSPASSTSPLCGTPSQSSSNSILRLMGKDLMISHNEESSNLPKFSSPARDNHSTVQSFPPPLHSASCAGVPGHHESFTFAVRSPAPPIANMQACSRLPCAFPSKAYQEKDALVNDGSSDDDMITRGTLFPVPSTHAMFQRVSPCFPPHNQLWPGENGYVANEGGSLEVPASLLRRPFMFRFPSAAHLNAPIYRMKRR